MRKAAFIACAAALLMAGCVRLKANDHAGLADPSARWARGAGDDQCYWRLLPDQRARLIRAINGLPMGIAVREAIATLGPADSCEDLCDKLAITFTDEKPPLELRYEFTRKFKNRINPGEDESVSLVFCDGRLVGVNSDFQEVLWRDTSHPRGIFPRFLDCVAVYPDPGASTANLANERRISAALRSQGIMFRSTCLDGDGAVLVERDAASQAERIVIQKAAERWITIAPPRSKRVITPPE